MVRSARARPKGRRSYSAPQDLDATAVRLDSTGGGLTERRVHNVSRFQARNAHTLYPAASK
jgi:hypothetical protein